MSLISVARNAARWLGFDLGRADGHVAQAVVVIDPATGEAGASGLTDAQLRASAVPVSLAATPGLTDTQLRAAAVVTTDSQGGTRQHNTAGGIRQAVGVGPARVALPTLSASREMYVTATQRCFFLTGDSSVTAVNTTGLTNMSHPLAADERFYFRVPAGHTHIAYKCRGCSVSPCL
jgi:hypothetical protein